MIENSYINNCPITGKKNKITYFDLGNIPLVNNLSNTRDEAMSCKKYPLSLNYFYSSKLTSLSYAVDSKTLFSEYLFKSGVNIPYIKHCKEMFKEILNYYNLEDYDIVVDIGGNDGTLLESFKEENNAFILNYLNIDPSVNLTDICKSKGIDTITDFFTEELVSKLNFKAKLITSTNVFQHLKNINSFVKGIKNLLDSEGIWILEFPYWINSMETNQFDQVYHEHMHYYSVTPLKLLFENNGLKIIDISKQEIHGGSLRLTIGHKSSSFIPSPSIKQYLNQERKYNFEYHIKWGKNIWDFILKSQHELLELIYADNKIYGFGAAAKGCIFLNAINFTYRDIPYIIDDTDIKQSKFIPGIGSEVISREILKTSPPDYILILAHNFKDYIIKSLKDYGYKGKFITLIPEFKIYE